MTNLQVEDFDEIIFADEHNLEPGFPHTYQNGDKEYSDSRANLHRWLGPARIRQNIHEWFIHGKKLECTTQEEFEIIRARVLKFKVFW